MLPLAKNGIIRIPGGRKKTEETIIETHVDEDGDSVWEPKSLVVKLPQKEEVTGNWQHSISSRPHRRSKGKKQRR